jgi:hypothetical protein
MLLRPVEHFAATSPHDVVVARLSASLHAEPATLRERIQAKVDRADPSADAIVLAYGLCGGATAGVEARDVPLVLPRAHDCATIFLGSRDRYQREHEATPGTYWYTRDQLERGNALKGWLLGDAARSEDALATRRDYEGRFGKDNADYLMETLGEWSTRYERGAYLDMGLGTEGGVEGDSRGDGDVDDGDEAAAERAREESERRGWRFERVPTNLSLVRRLLHGEWDEDFQIVEPGQRLEMSYDDGVVRAADAGHETIDVSH